MENIDLASLIVGVVAGVGMTQLVMWIFIMGRHPSFDYLSPAAPSSSTTFPSGRKEPRPAQGSSV